jgi:hypothetical protein
MSSKEESTAAKIAVEDEDKDKQQQDGGDGDANKSTKEEPKEKDDGDVFDDAKEDEQVAAEGEDDGEDDEEGSPSKRTSLGRSAKAKKISYAEVTAVGAVYVNNDGGSGEQPKKRARRSSAASAATTSPRQASTPGTPGTPGKKKVFFNNPIVQDTIWKALSELGWTSTKPYKTQRNYHAPKDKPTSPSVFDSIGKVMDFVRKSPDWNDLEKVKEGLEAFEKEYGNAGGTTAMTASPASGATKRKRRSKVQMAAAASLKSPSSAQQQLKVDKLVFGETLWKTLQELGWTSNTSKAGEECYYQPSAVKVEGAIAGVDYFTTCREVIEMITSYPEWKDQEQVQAALNAYETAVETKTNKKKSIRRKASAAAQGQDEGGEEDDEDDDEDVTPKKRKKREGGGGPGKPRPHKFSTELMQNSVWKALSDLGWTTGQRGNTSKRNYYPPEGSGSKRNLYQTITQVLECIRKETTWKDNENIIQALVEYDKGIAAGMGAGNSISPNGKAAAKKVSAKAGVKGKEEDGTAEKESVANVKDDEPAKAKEEDKAGDKDDEPAKGKEEGEEKRDVMGVALAKEEEQADDDSAKGKETAI